MERKKQGTLINIGVGNEQEKGNRLLRFVDTDGRLFLRITTGNREFIHAKVLRRPSNEKDRWNTFFPCFLVAGILRSISPILWS